MMIVEILLKTLTCLLMSLLFLAYWRRMINLMSLFINIYIYIYIYIFAAIDIHLRLTGQTTK